MKIYRASQNIVGLCVYNSRDARMWKPLYLGSVSHLGRLNSPVVLTDTHTGLTDTIVESLF